MQPKQETSAGTGGRRFCRMQFFWDFMAAADINMSDVAKTLNLTRPAISHALNASDTMTVRQVYTVIEHYGYELDILLTREREELDSALISGSFISVPRSLYRGGNANLLFLTTALSRYGISKKQLAEALGINYTSIRNWYLSDDVSVARIFDICNAMNFSVKFTITQKDCKETGSGERECRIILNRKNGSRFGDGDFRRRGGGEG